MAKRVKRDIFSGKLVEEEYEPSPTGRTIIARETLPFGQKVAPKRARQSAIREDKPHVSMAVACHPKQADSFNKVLADHGIKNAHYSRRNGKLYSYDRESRAAAWAVRGFYDREGGSVEQKYANAIGY